MSDGDAFEAARALYEECRGLVPNFRVEVKEFSDGTGLAWYADVAGQLYACGTIPRNMADVRTLLLVGQESLRRVLGLPDPVDEALAAEAMGVTLP